MDPNIAVVNSRGRHRAVQSADYTAQISDIAAARGFGTVTNADIASFFRTYQDLLDKALLDGPVTVGILVDRMPHNTTHSKVALFLCELWGFVDKIPANSDGAIGTPIDMMLHNN